MKKSKILKSIIVMLLGVILFSLTGCTSKVTIETDGDNDIQIQTNVVSENDSDEKKSNTSNETSENKSVVNNNSSISKEEIVKEVYLNYIAEMKAEENYELSDSVIDNVQIVSFNEIKKISPDIEMYYPGVKDSDIFATVTYSVKPTNSVEESFWLAGDGEISGQWIKNKTANVWLVENNGEYTIESNATGW